MLTPTNYTLTVGWDQQWTRWPDKDQVKGQENVFIVVVHFVYFHLFFLTSSSSSNNNNASFRSTMNLIIVDEADLNDQSNNKNCHFLNEIERKRKARKKNHFRFQWESWKHTLIMWKSVKPFSCPTAFNLSV